MSKVKYSQQFAMNKQAQKVKYVATDTAIPSDEGGDTPTPPSGGGGNNDDLGDGD